MMVYLESVYLRVLCRRGVLTMGKWDVCEIVMDIRICVSFMAFFNICFVNVENCLMYVNFRL